VLAGRDRAMGIPIAPHLVTGWQDSPPVSLSVFYAAFRREMSPAERAYWRHGANARADHRTYLERTIAHRNACWQTDHTRLDIPLAEGTPVQTVADDILRSLQQGDPRVGHRQPRR
jgi:hypothetical protein